MYTGLNSQEVSRLQHTHGRNVLVMGKQLSDWDFMIAQFKNPLVLVLLLAAVGVGILGHWRDVIMILVAVVINVGLGFFQERRAFRALESLKKVLSLETWVHRDGKKIKIDSTALVPGDLVWLYEGDRVPADMMLLENHGLRINESMLTGESDLVMKKIDHFSDITSIYEDDSKIYSGTTIMAGTGRGVVLKIGMDTQVGKIAHSLNEVRDDKTPLVRRLEQLSGWLTIMVILVAIVVLVYGVLTGRVFLEMLLIAVALAVSAIPEGLVISLTMILAIGMQRILTRKAVVRTLVAAETLGSVTTVCVDKTGTLTEGSMEVVDCWWQDELLGYRAAVLANDRQDANELARWEWALEYSGPHTQFLHPEKLLEMNPRDDVLPFSSDRRFLLVRCEKELWWAGSPELLLKEGFTTHEVFGTWADQGRRLIGLGYMACHTETKAREVFSHIAATEELDGIDLVGVMAFDDPVRKGVKEALRKAALAGLSVKVITGDMRSTAVAVMKQLGIEPEQGSIIEGWELERMSDQELSDVVKRISLFARTRPSQKLAIVKALKAHGEVLAMMGDGINDAPALVAADIGIVVQNATDVAKESADMVLLDSNFETILAAIEEGRGIFSNLRKVILYLLSDTFSELIIVVGGLFLGWPLAITAAQVLWINLVDDGLPNLALTVDPKARDLLKRKPIPRNEALINNEMSWIIGVISVITGVSSLLVFGYYWPLVGVVEARSIIFVLLSIDSLLYVFSCRSLRRVAWDTSGGKNIWLVLSVFVGLIMTILAMYWSPVATFLGLVPIAFGEWMVIVCVSFLVIGAIEGIKYIYRRMY